jgi:CubicO group peptidase (beta-lactamase class C family)
VKTYSLFLFLIILCASCDTANKTIGAKPKTAAVNAGQPTNSEFKQMLVEAVKTHNLAGVQAAVFTHQEILNIDAEGFANVTAKRALQKSDKMHLGNCGELLTGLVAAAVVEKGKLRWDSKLTDVLAIRTSLRPEYQAITLRDCLSHNTKLPRCDDEKTMEDALTFRQGKTTADNRSSFVTHILRQDPLEQVSYSYADYLVAIAMLERATGQPFEILAADFVLKPLGISAKIGDAKTSTVENYTRKGSTTDWLVADPLPAVFSSADIFMNAADYCRLLQEVLKVYKKADKKDKLGQDLKGTAVQLRLIEEMQVFKPKTAFFNALGQRNSPVAKDALCTTGSSNGSTAHYYLFPERNMGIVFLLNSTDRTDDDENALNDMLSQLKTQFAIQ